MLQHRLVWIAGILIIVTVPFLHASMSVKTESRMAALSTPSPHSPKPQLHVHGSKNDSSPFAAERQVTDVSSNTLPLAVDGSIHPELIPDAIAYRHFISASSIRSGGPTDQLRRRKAILKKVGFDEFDEAAFIGATETVGDEMASITAERASLSSAGATKTANGRLSLRQLQDRESVVFANARNRLRSALSQRGAQRLDEHVKGDVKRKIKIYGSLPK